MCIFSSNNRELIHHSTHEPDGGDSRYSSQGYNRRNENVSQMEEDVPMERYEEVEAPAEPAPVPTRPKPRPKKAPKKPRAAVNVGQTCYTRGGEASVGRPAVARPGPAGGGGQHQPRALSPRS